MDNQKALDSARGSGATDIESTKSITTTPVAIIISLCLCIALYFSMLSMVFTKEVTTFSGYTQEGMSVIHSTIECRFPLLASKDDGYYFDFSKQIIKTTTYENPDMGLCSRCRSGLEEVTITAKDYITPIFIALPLSALTFFILTYKKKNADYSKAINPQCPPEDNDFSAPIGS